MFENVYGGPPPGAPVGAGDHTRRWRRRYTLILAGAGLTGVLTGLVGLLLLQPDAGSGSRPWWVFALVLVLPAVMIAVTGLAVWRWQSRSEPVRTMMRISTPASAREVGKALKAGRPLDVRQREIAQTSVDAADRRRWPAWAFPAFGVVYLVLALHWSDGTDRWLRLVLAAVFLLNGVAHFWTRRTLLLRAARQGIRPAARAARPR